MNILLDAMGGDNAPDANIKGAVNAITKVKANVTLIGKEEIIRRGNNKSKSKCNVNRKRRNHKKQNKRNLWKRDRRNI